jgi:hypothetical protein
MPRSIFSIWFLFFVLLFSLSTCNKNSTSISEKSNNETVIVNEIVTDNETVINTENNVENENDDEEPVFDIDLLSLDLQGIKSRGFRFVEDTDNNKFIGYIRLNEVYPEIPIGGVFSYEKYIVMEEFYKIEKKWYMGGFCVYEYDEELQVTEYKKLGHKLYDCTGDPSWCEGINGDLLFIESGTGPGIRGITVFDLANSTTLVNASYDRFYGFYNNVINGLILTEWDIENEEFDDNIEKMFYDYKQKNSPAGKN